jgi:hypothetical protein
MMQHDSNHEFRPVKRLLGVAVVGLGVLALATSGNGSPAGDVPTVGNRIAHEQLQIDAYMIEQMATPNAHTGRQNHRDDPQVERSRDPGYLAALERHQADIDRMLARP